MDVNSILEETKQRTDIFLLYCGCYLKRGTFSWVKILRKFMKANFPEVKFSDKV